MEKNTQKSKLQEQVPAVLLISMQLSMVAALTAIVSSTWYSEYFNQGIKEQLVGSYKALRAPGTATNPAVQNNFDRLSKKSGLQSSLIDMHTDEELTLASLKDDSIREKRLAVLRSWLLKVQTEETEAIVLEKLIRCELVAAKIALQEGNWQRAEALSQEALEDLKQQKGRYEFSPQRRYVTAILDVSSQAKSLAGKSEEAKRLERLAERLKDPDFAEGWYRRNQLAGYASSYQPEYAVRFILGNAPDSADKTDTILKAIAVCGRANMTNNALRLSILHESLEFATRTGKPKIGDAALDVWAKYCADIPVIAKDQGAVVNFLQIPAMRKRSPETMKNINAKIAEAISLDLIPHGPAEQYLRLLMPSESSCNLYTMDINLPITKAKAIAERLEKLLDLCEKKHLDDTWVKIYLALVLIQAGNQDEAEHLLRELLTPSKIDNIEKQISIVQAFAMFRNHLPHILSEKDNLKESAKACSLFETALKSLDWAPLPKTQLLTALGDLKFSVGQVAEGTKLREEAWRLTDQQEDFGSVSMSLNHVNALLYKSDFHAAEALFNKLEKRVPKNNDNYVMLHFWLTSLTRSLPAASNKILKHAKANGFPDAEFRKTVKMVRERWGPKDRRYLSILLYMAEYELCRGNYDESASYCNEIQESGPPKSNALYIPACDILLELGKKPKTTIPQTGEIVALRSTREELHCLYSTYLQLHRFDAAKRAKDLRDRIKEID